MSAKLALRNVIREKLCWLTPGEVAAKSTRICEAITRLPEWKKARVVCLYAPLANEPDVEQLGIDSLKICYPRVNGHDLDLYYVSDPRAMKRSRWNIREPAPEAQCAVDHREIDLIFVPGLAFSPEGARLGKGAGFYDRLLARPGWRAHKIGLCFDCQVAAGLPVEAHDHEVDCVVTESGVLKVWTRPEKFGF